MAISKKNGQYKVIEWIVPIASIPEGFDLTVDLSGLSLKEKLVFKIQKISAGEPVSPFQSREAASSAPFTSPYVY